MVVTAKYNKPVRLVFLLGWLGLAGCGADDSGSSAGETLTLDGLWLGSTIENVTTGTTVVSTELDTLVVFNDNRVYVLRTDEAQIGSVTLGENGASSWDMNVYPYANPDLDNLFFVGSDDSNNLALSALLTNPSRLVINYNTANRAGRLDLNTVSQVDIKLAEIAGEWETADATLSINLDGNFSGWNAATSCQWEGTLSRAASTLGNKQLLLSIERQNCTEFNQAVNNPVPGIAFLDGQGMLHFIAEEPSDVLWMQFESSTPITDTTTDTTTDTGG